MQKKTTILAGLQADGRTRLHFHLRKERAFLRVEKDERRRRRAGDNLGDRLLLGVGASLLVELESMMTAVVVECAADVFLAGFDHRRVFR